MTTSQAWPSDTEASEKRVFPKANQKDFGDVLENCAKQIMNSIDAMKAVNGTRELTIQSHSGEDGQMLISVSDTGVSLPSEHAE